MFLQRPPRLEASPEYRITSTTLKRYRCNRRSNTLTLRTFISAQRALLWDRSSPSTELFFIAKRSVFLSISILRIRRFWSHFSWCRSLPEIGPVDSAGWDCLNTATFRAFFFFDASFRFCSAAWAFCFPEPILNFWERNWGACESEICLVSS